MFNDKPNNAAKMAYDAPSADLRSVNGLAVSDQCTNAWRVVKQAAAARGRGDEKLARDLRERARALFALGK